MKKHFNLLSLVIIIVIVNVICAANEVYASGAKEPKIWAQSEEDSIINIANLWKQDSVGCLNLRMKYIGYIKKNFPIEEYTLYDALLLFGKPNLLYVNEAKFIKKSGDINIEKCIYIVYYYNSSCIEGKFDYEVKDRPMITFIFSSNGEGIMIR